MSNNIQSVFENINSKGKTEKIVTLSLNSTQADSQRLRPLGSIILALAWNSKSFRDFRIVFVWLQTFYIGSLTRKKTTTVVENKDVSVKKWLRK